MPFNTKRWLMNTCFTAVRMCARGAFFLPPSDGSIRSRCSGFVVCHWEPHEFNLNTRSKLKKCVRYAKRLLKDVIRASAVSAGLPRTHVWCSGRASALLSVSPSFRAPWVISPTESAAFAVTVTLQIVLYIRIRWREVWHLRLRRGPLGPDPTAGEFTRTATPNGAHRGGGTQWAHQGGKWWWDENWRGKSSLIGHSETVSFNMFAIPFKKNNDSSFFKYVPLLIRVRTLVK